VDVAAGARRLHVRDRRRAEDELGDVFVYAQDGARQRARRVAVVREPAKRTRS